MGINIKKQLTKISPLSAGLVLLFALAMTFIIFRSFAAVGPATLYTSPGGSQSVVKGKTFTVSVRVKTASNVPVTGASVYLSYPSSKVSVQSISYSGSPYNFEASKSNTGGILKMDRAAIPAISGGDKLFAKVTFKALATGSAAISFTSNSFVTSGEDDSDLSLQKSGVVYKVTAPSTSTNKTSSSAADTDDSDGGSNTSSTDESSSGSSSVENNTSTSGQSSDSTSKKSETKKSSDKQATSTSQQEIAGTGQLEILVVDGDNQPLKDASVDKRHYQ